MPAIVTLAFELIAEASVWKKFEPALLNKDFQKFQWEEGAKTARFFIVVPFRKYENPGSHAIDRLRQELT